MLRAPRSECPINLVVEMLGDPWSLVILRDIIFCGYRSFHELLTKPQKGVTPPTLSRRLSDLVEMGMLTKGDVPRGMHGSCSRTGNSISLVPLLFKRAAVGSMLDPSTEPPRSPTRLKGETIPEDSNMLRSHRLARVGLE